VKLKNFAVIGLVLAVAVGAVISFIAMAAIINGTPGDDTLVDTAANDVIRGFAGDDHITVAAMNDRVDAGDGDDQVVITAAAGRVYVVGGAGHDVIDASVGVNHRIFGNDGDDNILLGTGVRGARVEAGDGDDVIDVSAVATGNIVIYGGDGDDEIEGVGATANLKVYGGPGVDNITLGAGRNFVEAGEDADVVVAGTAATSRDIINIRVGDVPAGETEKITCTVIGNALTTVILKRNSLGSFPSGTPTQFDASGVLTIIDPLTGGVYEIREGNAGRCLVVRR
jgi:Ca2+-binding RTX toxin-like protein